MTYSFCPNEQNATFQASRSVAKKRRSESYATLATPQHHYDSDPEKSKNTTYIGIWRRERRERRERCSHLVLYRDAWILASVAGDFCG